MNWIGAVAGAANSGLGMLGSYLHDKRTMSNQERLMGIQKGNQQWLNEQGQQLQMKTWRETNYPAQIEMMKKAGLNPSLMYGLGGGGGTTTGSQGGGSAQGGQAPHSQTPKMGLLEGMMAEGQMKLMEAQAKKAEAEANKISGVDTQETTTRISKLIAETTNEKTKNLLMQIEAQTKRIEQGYIGAETEARIKNTVEQTKQLKLNNELTESQFNDIVEITRQAAIQGSLNNTLTKENIQLTKDRQYEITEGVLQKWEDLYIKGTAQGTRELEAWIKENYPSLWNVAGRAANDVYTWLKNIDNWITGRPMEERGKRPK